ncbi:hypothetical protein [Mycobacterium sp. ACS4331]|uniref:WXG100 family type VII secretion target n=1 Tax=Mycobacterium sp. ACS4331 TaxID=1834121 RepID=UPI0008018B92|nr:hypothetical protein [Mycobacterium sp. ACS4331]OBF29138.1 hypothetical protein A5727_24140 [Mycobacterium sp. ACS4331]
MGVVGADVDQLRTLAHTLRQAADRLESASGSVTSQLSGVGWSGPDADRYRSQWHGESQGLMRSAVATLRETASAVERNATDQVQASRADGGAAVTASGLPPSLTHILPYPMIDTSNDNPLVDIRDFLRSNALWPITWDALLGRFDDVAAVPLLDALGLVADDRISDGEKMLDAAGSATDVAGGLLKSQGTPVGYLSGVALSQWGDVLTAAARTDFSESGLRTTVDYLAEHPGDAFEAARRAVVGYVPKLFSNLLPW